MSIQAEQHQYWDGHNTFSDSLSSPEKSNAEYVSEVPKHLSNNSKNQTQINIFSHDHQKYLKPLTLLMHLMFRTLNATCLSDLLNNVREEEICFLSSTAEKIY